MEENIKWQDAEKEKPKVDTGHNDLFGIPIYDGDTLIQECKMVCDYTGEVSIEKQKLVVRFDKRKNVWSVYCPSAPNRDDWGYIPKTAYVTHFAEINEPK